MGKTVATYVIYIVYSIQIHIQYGKIICNVSFVATSLKLNLYFRLMGNDLGKHVLQRL